MAKIRIEVTIELPDEVLRALLPPIESAEKLAEALPRVIELEVVNASGKAVIRVLPEKNL